LLAVVFLSILSQPVICRLVKVADEFTETRLALFPHATTQ